jgi:hypothetical protein
MVREGIYNRIVVIGSPLEKLAAHLRRPKDLLQPG